MPNPLYRLSLILGWGKDNNFSFDKGDLSSCGAYSCELKKAYLPIVPFADCRRSHRLSFQVEKNQHICAGDEGNVYVAAYFGQNMEINYILAFNNI